MSDYSTLDRLLHRLALSSPIVAEMIHDVERRMYLDSAPEDAGRHVFVTGLARAGTTILMREIHRTGEFGSLTYADMPFVLAPNLWAKLNSRGQTAGKKVERAHGDGIEIDTQSPEALDEVYWRILDGKSYIGAHGLTLHDPGDAVMEGYRHLIRLVLRKTGKARYVTKNNNNILRLEALSKGFPRADFLVPIRRPLDHAASLLHQHRRFLDAEPFTRAYMYWLGHHEFGAAHRPFLFGGRMEGDPLGMNYWLNAWIAAYSALDQIESHAGNVTFVPYEALSSDPTVWCKIANRIGVDAASATELRPVSDREPEDHDPVLAETARKLHQRLSRRGFAALGLIRTK